MGRRDKNVVVTEVEIVDLGAKGKAVGKKDSAVFFVEGAVPGDVCDVQVFKKKKSFAEGKAVHFHTYSPDRIEAVCEHFGTCGGCKWQNLSYEAQLRYKEKDTLSNLKKIGGVVPQECMPILGCKEPYHYRNKLEFTFTDYRWITKAQLDSGEEFPDRNGVGFHIPGFWDKVVDVKKCHLQKDPSNAIRNRVREIGNEHGMTFYNIRQKSGFLRIMMVRTSTTNEVMVVFQLGEENKEWMEILFKTLLEEFPEITSLQYAINTKGNDSIYDLDIICYHGREYILEEMPPYYPSKPALHFRIGPKSFYQTNSDQAFELYKTALDFADLKEGQTVYDLYTGTGTIALFMAQKAAKVVGIESVPEAVNAANENAAFNKISNATFVVGDMKDELNDAFIALHGVPDVIVTDPPRDGMHAKVVEKLLELAVPKIVYVSCNPATQARDLIALSTKYNVVKSRAVDMFPQTQHIENVVLLELK